MEPPAPRMTLRVIRCAGGPVAAKTDIPLTERDVRDQRNGRSAANQKGKKK